MSYSRKIAERMWNQRDKGELEAKREETYMDDIVQKSHIEKALLEQLDGVHTAFDGGAGSGRFSILLAKHGVQVTHFDISKPMIDKARQIVEKEKVADRICFVQGALEDVSAFKDRSFDLVMSFDAPVSYTYPAQEEVIAQLVRMARKKVMFSVSSRLGSLPYLANPMQKAQFIFDDTTDRWAQWYLGNADNMAKQFIFDGEACRKMLQSGLSADPMEAQRAYDRGEAPWCTTYHFLPDELKNLLEKNGVTNIRLAGPGAFARTIPHKILQRVMNDPVQRRDFLDFSYQFDQNPYVCGMGKDNLLAIGDI